MSEKVIIYADKCYSVANGCSWKVPRNQSNLKAREEKYIKSIITLDSQLQLSLYVNYNIGAYSFIVQPSPCSKQLLRLQDVDQMIFITNDHIFVSLNYINHQSNG